MRGKAMNEFNFSVPQNIIVGRGSMAKLPEVAKNGWKACVYHIRTAS